MNSNRLLFYKIVAAGNELYQVMLCSQDGTISEVMTPPLEISWCMSFLGNASISIA